ncbi:MAG: sulfatase-like hydrolase/transferase [Bacteroidales bacterium]|nr:sulfatase-like hydrolase/transferase [Bacteroidales bacterium]
MRRHTRKELFHEWLGQPYMLLIYRLLAILLTLSISRWMLYLFNSQFFHQLSLGQALGLYFNGMRFDLPVVVAINLPVIIYYCFPSLGICRKGLQRVVNIYYVTLNAIAILLNFIDIVCFNFFGKHLTIDFVKVLGNSDEITFGIIRQVLFDYWYLLIIFILFALVINVVARHTQLHCNEKEQKKKWYLRQSVSLAVMLIVAWIAWRGGLQAQRITMQTTMEYTDPQNAPILLNTPFCLINTHDTKLEIRDNAPDVTYSPIHTELTTNRFLINDSLNADTMPNNVVLIIMKSVGQEMIGYYNPDRRCSLTPFLDSLLHNSLTFNGMANSRRSLEVLPSILASLPPLMENDFVRSDYSNNDFDAFAQHLQQKAYNTIFMHGGKNGTMRFDQFAHRAGFKNYFGRVEYGDDTDYDGQWGIYDGPFLQYAAKTLNRVHEPFATAIYTLSSRYPYKVPKEFELPEESYFWTGFEKTVFYEDCALRDFFATASKTSWFNNTLFVITSDYSNTQHFQPEYSNVWGMYAIPIAFYWPQHIEPQRCEEIAQQTDLGPSILAALKVNDTLLSYGRNLFDSLSEPAFVSYFNLTYQYCDGTYLVQSDGQNPFGIYKPLLDPLMNDNLIDRLQCPDIFAKLYAVLADYNKRMIFNDLKPTFDTIHETQE